jgi:hypothetical protein
MHVRRDNARIGAVSHADAPFAYDKPTGFLCIMGCAERFNGKISDRELLVIAAGMVAERFGGRTAAVQEISKRSLRGIDRNLQFPGQHVNAPDMVGMFVRDKEGLDPAGIDAGPFHPEEAFFCAQACIDEQCAAPAFNNNTIAFTPAGKHGTAHCLYYLPSSY